MENRDEAILDLLFKDGMREKGFRLLMQKYQESLYCQIFYLLKNHANTDDVLQNTWVKIWKGLPQFKGDSKLYTWLYRIAHNEALNFLIKENKIKVSELTEHSTYSLPNSAYSPSLNADEIEQKFQKALLKLPEKQKEVFCMRYYDEMTYEKISQLTGTSIGALKANFHHAAKKIELYLKEY